MKIENPLNQKAVVVTGEWCCGSCVFTCTPTASPPPGKVSRDEEGGEIEATATEEPPSAAGMTSASPGVSGMRLGATGYHVDDGIPF